MSARDRPSVDTEGSDWTEGLARVGLVSRGVVYTIFGLIAVRLAVEGSTKGEEASTAGAFGELVEKPFGKVLVGLVAVGLVCWAAVCALAAVIGRNGAKPGPSDPMDRVRDAIRAAASLLLAGVAVKVLTQGEQSASGGNQEQELTAKLMDAPAGRILVFVLGLAVLGVGIHQVVKAVKRDFLEAVDLGRMGNRPGPNALEKLGVAGHVAKGLIFTLIGGFLLRAAIAHDPDETQGIDGALRELAGGGPGRALLAAIAVGTVCFGIWTFVEARCRRADT